MANLALSQPVRFLICGGLAAAVNWGARIALSDWLPFEQAVIVAYVIGMGVGFVLYRTIVWPEHATSLKDQIVGFVLVNAVSAALVFGASVGARLALQSLIPAGGIADAAAHAFGIAVGAVANYLGHRAFTFRGAAG